jgi:hypothetical protein
MRAWGLGRRRRAFLTAIAATSVVAISVSLGGTGDGQSAPWPDGRVAALWPTFSSIPATETGAGGLPAWDGAFRRCVQSRKLEFDFACEYEDGRGNLGYACVAATGPDAPISPASIDARVGPGDPTYAGKPPTSICVSARAYALSLG